MAHRATTPSEGMSPPRESSANPAVVPWSSTMSTSAVPSATLRDRSWDQNCCARATEPAIRDRLSGRRGELKLREGGDIVHDAAAELDARFLGHCAQPCLLHSHQQPDLGHTWP